jgi:hypothetical protein
MGLAESILAADDLPRVAVATPEWPAVDGRLFVHVMTGQQRRDVELFFRPSDTGDPQKGDPRAMLAALCVCDADGTQVFTVDQVAKLASKSATALDRIYQAALDINGMGGKADEAKKNSEETTGDDSASG